MSCNIFRKLILCSPKWHNCYNVRHSSNKLLETVSNTVWPERILSGIQPTGTLHLGNYIGAVENWIKLQNSCENVIFPIVDLHSITIRYDPKKLPDNILLMVASLLGCGINPNKSSIFLQSQVPEHTQLGWILTCICTSNRLARLPQYREKTSEMKSVPLGLYLYPVLQCADILLYRATKVPVGIDQIHHIQLCSELAKKFNFIFGETFPIPEAIISRETSKIKNLRNPTLKMSKSYPDPKSRITITDSDDSIVEYIKKALTDGTSSVSFDPSNRPGVSNLITIYSAITGKIPEEICEESAHLDTGKFKMVVAEAVVEFIKPIRTKVMKYYNDKSYLTKVLESGAERVSPIARETWGIVCKNCGTCY